MFKLFKRDKPVKKKVKKIIFKDDGIKYVGEVDDNDIPNGTGAIYDLFSYNRRKIYEGEFKDGVMHGQGTYTNSGGNQFIGTFENKVFKTGTHIMTWCQTTTKYVGKFENFQLVEGDIYINDKREYTGCFKNNKYYGKGTVYHKNGKPKYVGDFYFGKQTGFGEIYDENGVLMYVGDVIDGYYNGAGTLYYDDGKTIMFSGHFKYNVAEGIGTVYDTDGKVKYKGIFSKNQMKFEAEEVIDDKLYGFGHEYYSNGVIRYEGTFANSLYHGDGKLFRSDGSLEYDGQFEAGKPHGLIKIYDSKGILLESGYCLNGYKSGSWKIYTDKGIQKKEYKYGVTNQTYLDNHPSTTTYNGMDDYRFTNDYPPNKLTKSKMFESYSLLDPDSSDESIKPVESPEVKIQKELLDAIKAVTWETQVDSIEPIENICKRLKTLNFGNDHLTSPLLMVCCDVLNTKTYNGYLIQLFVNLGADVNHRSAHGSTPIMYLAQSGKLEMLRYMLHKGANHKLVDYKGRGLYHYAKDSKNEELIQFVANMKEVPKKTKPVSRMYGWSEIEEVKCDCIGCQDTIFICSVDHENEVKN
jgi:antitoxin component YwqK of YwqJK toxin-antitoxin module